MQEITPMTDTELEDEFRDHHQQCPAHNRCTCGAETLNAATIEEQAAEIQRLREALRKYGQHLIRNGLGCFLADGTERCTCGLSDALAEG